MKNICMLLWIWIGKNAIFHIALNPILSMPFRRRNSNVYIKKNCTNSGGIHSRTCRDFKKKEQIYRYMTTTKSTFFRDTSFLKKIGYIVYFFISLYFDVSFFQPISNRSSNLTMGKESKNSRCKSADWFDKKHTPAFHFGARLKLVIIKIGKNV